MTRKDGREVEIVGNDLDYFRVEFPDEYAYLKPVWDELYGPKPKIIRGAFLASPEIDMGFPTWMEEHATGRLVRRCDGETQVLRYLGVESGYSDAPVKCDAPKCGCRRVGRLKLLLPELIKKTGVLGYVTLTTGSIYDIKHLHTNLTWAASNMGTLQGVMFEVGRTPREVHPVVADKKSGEKKRITVTKSLLYIRVAPEFTRRVILPALSQYQGPDVPQISSAPTPAPMMLADGTDDDDDDVFFDDVPTAPDDGFAPAPVDDVPMLAPHEIADLYAYAKAKGITDKETLFGILEISDIKQWALGLERAYEVVDIWHELNAKQADGDDQTVEGEFEDANDDAPADADLDEPITIDNFKTRRRPLDALTMASIASLLAKQNTSNKVVPKAITTKIAMLIAQAAPADMDKAAQDELRHTVCKLFFNKVRVTGENGLTFGEATALVNVLTDSSGKLHPQACSEIVDILLFTEELERGTNEY